MRVFKSVPVVRAMLVLARRASRRCCKSFSQDDRDHMVENGKISVTCEFCSANYEFAPEDVGAAPDGGPRRITLRNHDARRAIGLPQRSP